LIDPANQSSRPCGIFAQIQHGPKFKMTIHASPLRAAMLALLILVAATPLSASAARLMPRDGWVMLVTDYSLPELVQRVEAAAMERQIGVVTRASATVGAKRVLDVDIPGNMVIGLFHPRFAVRMLEASIAAGIEAPIRLYLTDNEDGTTTLSYKEPGYVFSPYMAEGGAALEDLAKELDELFAALAAQAAGQD
jgi:uncharacterized protein (DUF302 family)